jgi:hypothetical protein
MTASLSASRQDVLAGPLVFPRGVVSSDASGLAFASSTVASPAHRRVGDAHLTPLVAAGPHLSSQGHEDRF